ncbi:class I SAM-dependent methyltransferase [Caldisalinibacter kiritimatiensis]|uniref:UbiE/COQ5 methyltransferase n=1 Tax=Caldisalinibacter kiritimatiensis TaxID=1304284 RepID=R1CEF8_9FIRM|nr:class I SAM-dependent methyltransferase [Caldisalinibacter kiritimatiensis]EOD00680.1 ubiE/COQ5 methyltransferase [Caldisalinibacter kiritimatiensis]
MAVFDNEANSYDAWYESKLGKFVDKVEKECAFELFSPRKGMKVLDVGCGTGNYSIELAKMGCEVVGIDISDEMLDIAKNKAKENNLDIEFYNMDVYNIKFDDESFDAVFSMAAFEFIKEPEKAIEEIFRVVKKDGQVLIGTINKKSAWGELYLSEEFQKNSIFKYAQFKTLDELKKLKSNYLVDTAECLFIPPNIDEKDISMEKEKDLSNMERGGFICVLWKK